MPIEAQKEFPKDLLKILPGQFAGIAEEIAEETPKKNYKDISGRKSQEFSTTGFQRNLHISITKRTFIRITVRVFKENVAGIGSGSAKEIWENEI